MYYRYEARRTDVEDGEFKGIFQAFTPSQRKKWYCLAVPKWYEKNPDVESQAWFTQHGYDKWHEKMEDTIREFLDLVTEDTLEIRLLKKETLENIVFEGKTQCIIKLSAKESA